MIGRIRVLYVVIVIMIESKSKVWPICHCLGHETDMRCTSFYTLIKMSRSWLSSEYSKLCAVKLRCERTAPVAPAAAGGNTHILNKNKSHIFQQSKFLHNSTMGRWKITPSQEVQFIFFTLIIYAPDRERTDGVRRFNVPHTTILW